MKFVLVIAVLLSTAGLVFATSFLSDRHIEDYGAECMACHDTEAPEAGAWVEPDKCMSCHTSWEELAERTVERGEHNPHSAHLGEIDCTLCHRGHTASELYCVTCHTTLDPTMK